LSTLVEGRNAVLEALRSDMPVSRVFVAEGLRSDHTLVEIERVADRRGVPIERVRRQVLDDLSERGAHQGVIARAAPFRFTPLPRILSEAQSAKQSLLVALDHITDAGNLGAVARSAEVVGAHGLIVPSRRSAALGPGAYKSAAGALAWLPVAQEPNLVRALEACKSAGYWIAGASEHASLSAWAAPLEGRLVLVLGAEDSGLSRLVAENCDFLVSLPVVGRVGSLNVAQAASVLAYEWLRRGAAQA